MAARRGCARTTSLAPRERGLKQIIGILRVCQAESLAPRERGLKLYRLGDLSADEFVARPARAWIETTMPKQNQRPKVTSLAPRERGLKQPLLGGRP